MSDCCETKNSPADQKASQATSGSVASHKNPNAHPITGVYGTGANIK